MLSPFILTEDKSYDSVKYPVPTTEKFQSHLPVQPFLQHLLLAERSALPGLCGSHRLAPALVLGPHRHGGRESSSGRVPRMPEACS